jgi:hypothetical protein
VKVDGVHDTAAKVVVTVVQDDAMTHLIPIMVPTTILLLLLLGKHHHGDVIGPGPDPDLPVLIGNNDGVMILTTLLDRPFKERKGNEITRNKNDNHAWQD